jgi:hypothetical protein
MLWSVNEKLTPESFVRLIEWEGGLGPVIFDLGIAAVDINCESPKGKKICDLLREIQETGVHALLEELATILADDE